ncbi:hypothetical protein [Pleionea sp. CnH1-48]|uniref:hypothetical protein n=1 Tax=Pleionea sp. CnH1-48 TaxID=2954494 RepID=UPI0020969207|nr:hypothetical protein [Pleionea sp. CnH1-48]MCO7223709.1 hypothetical protein [Pleionea sp. CnH1-48]
MSTLRELEDSYSRRGALQKKYQKELVKLESEADRIRGEIESVQHQLDDIESDNQKVKAKIASYLKSGDIQVIEVMYHHLEESSLKTEQLKESKLNLEDALFNCVELIKKVQLSHRKNGDRNQKLERKIVTKADLKRIEEATLILTNRKRES